MWYLILSMVNCIDYFFNSLRAVLCPRILTCVEQGTYVVNTSALTRYTLINAFVVVKLALLPPRLLPPANVVCEGYVFTGVCLSTGGMETPSWMENLPQMENPPGWRTPLIQKFYILTA